ncbi:helix-turn-helix domain-containing protein [Leptospira interrogans]|uniref:helix-turn-helix domain-containing protein n=1 Tax=Leptospira interrogans TaxID=173 RepID=UPI001CE38BD5|nr:helix-turn-helix transcriptional regulator [Leptospira interrogans]
MKESKNQKILLERLRLAREQAGLSQEQVSKLLKVSRPAITDIESGKRKVSTDELIQLSDVYDVSINWLLGKDEKLTDAKYTLAARELAKLNPKDIEKVLSLLKSLK